VKPLLEVRGLTKIFGDPCGHCVEQIKDADTNICPVCGSVVACGDVSFDLYPGEVLGVVGESGSGKSTLVRLLHFDWEATAGRVYYNMPQANQNGTENVLDLSPYYKRQIRNTSLGIVYQNAHEGLRMNVTAGGNIAERLITANWRNVGNMRTRSATLLNRTEIPVSRMDEPPRNFSGGMQQRVQIAKALSCNPALLLLDEVTTGLDLSVQARVLDLIRSLHRELHISMIVVSHDLGVIRTLTSRTMVMKHGRVVESVLTDQILEDPQHKYTQLLVSSQL